MSVAGNEPFNITGSFVIAAAYTNTITVSGSMNGTLTLDHTPVHDSVTFSNVTFTILGVYPYIDAYRWNGAISYTHDPANASFLATNQSSKELYACSLWQNATPTNYYVWTPEISPCPSPADGIGTASPVDQYVFYKFEEYEQGNFAPTNTDGAPAIEAPYDANTFRTNEYILGWRLTNALWLLKWDGTNGFEMQ